MKRFGLIPDRPVSSSSVRAERPERVRVIGFQPAEKFVGALDAALQEFMNSAARLAVVVAVAVASLALGLVLRLSGQHRAQSAIPPASLPGD